MPDYDELNMRLRKKLLALADSYPDTVSHNPSGRSYFENKWLSKSGLHKDPDEAIQTFVEFVLGWANKLAGDSGREASLAIRSMWCIIGRQGLTGSAHGHGGTMSCAYYVDPGNPQTEGSGNIQFYAPGTSPETDKPVHVVAPRSGLLLLFPSHMKHSVSAYSGTKPRIVISCNLS